MGRSSWTSAGFNWSVSSCPAEVRKSGRENLEFRLPCSIKTFQDGNRHFGTQRHDHVPNTSQWSQSHKIRQVLSPGGRLPRSPSPAQVGDTRAKCRGIVDIATASPAAPKRMTGKRLLDVFRGSGFLAKSTNHFGMRGCVLDTKFGSRTTCSHQHSRRRLRWRM